MNDKKETRNIIIFAAILVLFIIAYIVVDKLTNKQDLGYEEYLKNYDVNEYIPTYISDEDMAEIYLKHYIHTMFSDVEKAYALIDTEYKTKKFGDIVGYKNYINSLTYTTYEVDKFYVNSKKGYKIYGVYDKNGNLFIFKTKGVMQYTVYLDDYTVEI